MQDPGFTILFASFLVVIIASSALMYGHRPLARRLVDDPEEQPRRSVELATAWPMTLISTCFPLMALLMPREGLSQEVGYGTVAFFGLGVVWMFAILAIPKLTRHMADQAFVATKGSREHGETPELYEKALRRGLPWAGALVTLAFVIALLRLTLQV